MSYRNSVKVGECVPLVYFNLHGKTLPEDAWQNAKWVTDKVRSGDFGDNDGESGGTGELVISEPGRSTSLRDLFRDLEGAGYHLVFVGKRNSHNAGADQTHRVLRYVFRRTPHEDARIRALSDRMLIELKAWTASSMFNLLVHENPFYAEGKPKEGVSLISIDANGRDPLVKSDGTPVTRWLKDSLGGRVGDAPFLVKPSGYLGIDDDSEVCVFVEEDDQAEVKATLLSDREAEIKSGSTVDA